MLVIARSQPRYGPSPPAERRPGRGAQVGKPPLKRRGSPLASTPRSGHPRSRSIPLLLLRLNIGRYPHDFFHPERHPRRSDRRHPSRRLAGQVPTPRSLLRMAPLERWRPRRALARLSSAQHRLGQHRLAQHRLAQHRLSPSPPNRQVRLLPTTAQRLAAQRCYPRRAGDRPRRGLSPPGDSDRSSCPARSP